MATARKEILRMPRYPVQPDWDGICLDQNESAYEMPEKLKLEIAAGIMRADFRKYPDSTGLELREKIARKEGCSPENVLLGNGADEILRLTALTFLPRGARAVTLWPSFIVIRQACAIAGCRLETVPFGPGFSYPAEFARKARGKAAFVCSPNNPTGTVVPRKGIDEIAENASLVVLDQAYAEFCGGKSLVQDDVICVRTFSKAYACAAARIGYAVAPEKIIAALDRARPPWNVGILAQITGKAVLENAAVFEDRARSVVAERKRLSKGLSKFARVYPSGANFLLVESQTINFDSLLRHGIRVREIDGPRGLSRITVGTPEENGALLRAANEIASEGRKSAGCDEGNVVSLGPATHRKV